MLDKINKTMKMFLVFFILLPFSSLLLGQDTTYTSVTKQLLAIDELDQLYRNQINDVEVKYGGDSKEMKDLFKKMEVTDSLNLVQVEAILQKYGWLETQKIGSEANTALFMVIQHADLKNQIHYLPLMREAVRNGKAKASSLALLEDRVALRSGKKQIYGSQISWNMKTNTSFVAPLEDPDNVDKRRAEVGLPPLADYLINMKWDVDQYKKDLPLLEAEFFKLKK
jgi:hypothetical protein